MSPATAAAAVRTPMSNQCASAEHEAIEVREEKLPVACCAKFGRTRFLCQRSANAFYFPHVLHVGPNLGCMLITYSIILAPTLIFVFANSLASWVSVLLIVSIALTFLSFSMVACSDPGVIREHYVNAVGDDAGILCAHCQIRRPLNAIHCYECEVCIDGMDHHCPWTGKCIGKKTLYWFYLFLWMICIHMTFGIGTVVYYCIGGRTS
ncbi:hypothetical protein H257_08764 [Aphanomyces astaci]|uniref:Palmitoyltransferase n=1 Tax=Aphanomyces astaci TaxID=112090 RepID=W4GEC2_APHAT|nr:hypothetical protein H257_08764 [Aphanomyces astaci]ETV77318.1 hypothetical protein H257_08764 [Aphanomyces astaci]|eukprot:XP_009833105.1 hypothetical protein H257_08764 [Aphanomyces astaci]